MQYTSLCVWLLIFSIRFSRFIHVVACTSVSFLFVTLNNSPLRGYTTLCLPKHQLLGICIVSTFWLLWINAAMNICVWFLYDYMSLILLDKIPGRGTAGLYVNCMFDFMRNCQTLPTAAASFTLLPAVCECSSFSTSSPILGGFLCFFLNISSGHELVELVSYCDWFVVFFVATPHSIWDLRSPGMKPVPLALRAWNLNQSWTIGEFPYWGFDLHFPQCFDSLSMTQVFSLYPSLLAFATVLFVSPNRQRKKS